MAKLGKKIKGLEEAERPACPWQFVHIWQWLNELLSGCTASGMGPITIGWQDLLAWCELTGERPAPWETRLLMRLSVLRANIEGEEHRKEAKQQTKPKGRR